MAKDHPTGQSGLYQAFLQLKTPEQCYRFLQDVCSYSELSAMEQRYNLFLERREAVMAQIKELEDQLKVIDYKCKYYEEAIAAGTEDIHKHKTGHCCDDEKENKDA